MLVYLSGTSSPGQILSRHLHKLYHPSQKDQIAYSVAKRVHQAAAPVAELAHLAVGHVAEVDAVVGTDLGAAVAETAVADTAVADTAVAETAVAVDFGVGDNADAAVAFVDAGHCNGLAVE